MKPLICFKEKDKFYTLYTVQHCRLKDEKLYGPTHGSENGNETICGIEIDEKFWLLNNTFDGDITCKKCIKIMEEN